MSVKVWNIGNWRKPTKEEDELIKLTLGLMILLPLIAFVGFVMTFSSFVMQDGE
jgi:hypothetical protein